MTDGVLAASADPFIEQSTGAGALAALMIARRIASRSIIASTPACAL